MKSRGFTLIELLVAMAIMAVGMSLVGPLTIAQFDKYKMVEEREKVQRVINQVEHDAFLTHQSLIVISNGNNIEVWADTVQPQQLETYQFEYINFPSKEYRINGNAFWLNEDFTWHEKDIERQQRLQ